MNYQKIYDDLVSKAKSENRKKRKQSDELYVYYERHHIVPKCMDGSNLKENLVLFTGREHFVAHKLLVEIYPDNKKLNYSLWMMTSIKSAHGRIYRVSSREYERMKTWISLTMSKRDISEETLTKLKHPKSQAQKDKQSQLMMGKFVGELNPNYKRPYSLESLEKMSKAKKGKPHTKEHNEKIGKSSIGRVHSQESKDKIGLVHKDKIVSIETRKKLSDKGKLKPLVICPYCGKQGSGNIMNISHFENCKQNPDRVIVTYICPYCNKSGESKGAMFSKHFDNCPQNPDYVPKKYIPKERSEIICPHCNFIGYSKSAMKHWHFDNCKNKPKI